MDDIWIGRKKKIQGIQGEEKFTVIDPEMDQAWSFQWPVKDSSLWKKDSDSVNTRDSRIHLVLC
jgi:hypothetical protein